MRVSQDPVSAAAPQQKKNVFLRSNFLSLKGDLSSNYPAGNTAGKILVKLPRLTQCSMEEQGRLLIEVYLVIPV